MRWPFTDILTSPTAAYETVLELEARVAARYGGAWAVSVNSATSGLLASLLAVGVGPGDGVLLPGLTWPGTWFPAAVLGARLVPVDLAPWWPVMDARLCRRIQQEGDVAAVVTVGLYGYADGIAEVQEAATADGIPHILDAAQLGGAAGSAQSLAGLADLVVVSFGPGKSVSCAGGGAVIGTDEELHERLLMVTQHPFRVVAEGDDEGLRPLADGFTNNLSIHPLAAAAYLALTDGNGSGPRTPDGHTESASILEAHGAGPLDRLLWGPLPSNGSLLGTVPADDREGYRALVAELRGAGFTAARCRYAPFDDVLSRRDSLYPWLDPERHRLSVLTTDLPNARRWADDLVIVDPATPNSTREEA